MRQHKCQLVLQLTDDCPLESLDFEDDIAVALGEKGGEDPNHIHFVDGHSSGAGAIEFFIHTDDPADAFQLCKPLLDEEGLTPFLTAAWRQMNSEKFSVIWPPTFEGAFEPC